ncbi:MAG: beta-ketoacyl-[acyl-carrier-protein] synthase family protein [Candidatus Omnitrophota bacterium]
MKKKAVITGIGVISPLGKSKEEFWGKLFKGESAFHDIALFDTEGLKVKKAGEISDFEPKVILGEKGLMDVDRASLILMSAAKLALDDAGLEITQENTHSTGVSIGTTFGSLYSMSRFDRESLTEGPRYVNPSIFPSMVGSSPASRLGIRYNIKGFNTTVSTGMCAGLDALDYSRDFIELDRADTIISGGLGDLNIQTFLGFYKLGYLAGLKNGSVEEMCPFDKRRSGIILSEGAVIFIVQDKYLAKKQDRKTYGEILGTGSCFDPGKFYKYSPRGEGMKRAMELALEDAGIKICDIDCIFANANSTKDADLIESKAIKEVFGENVPVTAVKSIVGETFSASGTMSVLAALGAFEKQSIPAIANYREKDEDCDLDYVVGESRKKSISKVMINSFDPNGASSCMIVGKPV